MPADSLTGLRVRRLWPDGGLSESCGLVTHVSPCKRHPEWWPLADWCGYLPSEASGEASLEAQRAQFEADAAMPATVGCRVRWDAVVTGGGLVRLPRDRRRDEWVADARWLATVDGTPVDVPPLIADVPVAGSLL